MTNHENYCNRTRTSSSSTSSRSSSTSSSSTSSRSSSTSSSSTSSSSTTTAKDMDPGVSYFEELMERLAPLYEACVLCPMTVAITRKIKEYMEDYEISYEVVEAAVMDTGLAPRPSARYLLAILDRCACDEVCTIEDWKQEKRRHEIRNHERMRRKYPDGPAF